MFLHSSSAILLLSAALALPAAAQEPLRLPRSAVEVAHRSVGRAAGRLVVGFTLRLDSLHLRSNGRLVLMPMVRQGSRHRMMPFVVVNGRKQDITYRRYAHAGFPDDAQAVRRRNGEAQQVRYEAALPYEAWMDSADVVIAQDVCGCGEVEQSNELVIRRLRRPVMAYIRPQAEARKARAEEGSAFVDFPVDQTVLYPQYRNNPRELQKIVSTINLVRSDTNVSITGVEIHGYASPESPYAHNAYLARERARTLTDYVRSLVHLDRGLFTVSSTPEDWQGLRRAVAQSDLLHRSDILRIIDEPMSELAASGSDIEARGAELDRREWLIKSTYPDDYRFMLQHFYPALRHSDYVVRYEVRPFSVAEAREVFKTKPSQLSLEEMFLVAQTYAPGSPEFNEVFLVAARLYPSSSTANLNAACALIERGDFQGAETYLQRAGSSPYAAHARGVIALRRGREAEAIRLFEEAAAGGVPEARRNLELLQ